MFETADTALREGETAAAAPPPKASGDAGFYETFKATLQANIYQGAITGKETATEDAYDARIKAIKDKTGVELVNPFRVRDRFASQARREFEQSLQQLATERPEHKDTIRPDRPIEEDAAALTMGAARTSADLNERYGSTQLPLLGPVNLPGIAAGAIPADPFQMAALPVGGGAAGAGLRGVLLSGTRLGGANALATAASQPWKQAWLKEAGAEHGWSVASHEIAGAFLSGFLLDAGVRGAWRGGRQVLGYVPNLDAQGRVVGYRPEGTPAPAIPTKPSAAGPISQESLTAAAGRLPDDNPMRRAHDGDIGAQREVAQAFGFGDDPAMKGLIDHNAVERAQENPHASLIDSGDGMQRLTDALRREALPETELPVGRADPVLPARHASLADHEQLPSEAVATFRTAKGSHYELHADGTTTRNKAARSDPGHEGDSGLKPRSAITVYLPETQTQRLAMPQGTARIVDHGDGTLSVATLRDDGRWGIAPSARNIPVTSKPAVGLSPVELWKPENVNGLRGYRSIHLGNPITEITTKAAPATRRAASAFHVDGKPVAFEPVKASSLITDPETFQFKGGGDARGVTERMRGVEKWDPVAAGRAVIFEREDGTRVVADGHQRTGLARRLEDKGHEPISVDAIVFREADGWTPSDVRALAAKKNLQEGTGTAVDAAKVIRERPEIIDSSVPLSSDAMRQARSMARLSDEAFGHVVAGRIPPAYAALIGDIVPEKTRHLGLVNELLAAEPSNVQQARLALNELLSVPMHVEHQQDLFGAFRIERSLMRERVKVLDRALKLLREDARVFSLLEREAGRIESAGNKLKNDVNAERALQAEAVGEVIEQLATTRGPVSDWLNDGAREVAQGNMRPGRAAEVFAEKVRKALDEDGIKGLQAEPETLRAGAGIDAPGGPEAKAQVEALERQHATAIEEANAVNDLFADRGPAPTIEAPKPKPDRTNVSADLPADAVTKSALSFLSDKTKQGLEFIEKTSKQATAEDPRRFDIVYRDAEGQAQAILSFATNEKKQVIAKNVWGETEPVTMYVEPSLRSSGLAFRLLKKAREEGVTIDAETLKAGNYTEAGAAFTSALSDRILETPLATDLAHVGRIEEQASLLEVCRG